MMDRFVICRMRHGVEQYLEITQIGGKAVAMWVEIPYTDALWYNHPGSDWISGAYPGSYVRKLTLTLGEIV